MTTEDRSDLAVGLALGTFTSSERADALGSEARDPELKRAVEQLERKLAPLAATLPPEMPPAGVLDSVEARIEAEGASLPGTRTLRAGQYDWQSLGEGIDAVILWRNEETKRQSLLIRMQPGARYASHEHEDDEECLVIEGDLVFGDLTLKAGDYHFAPKGRTHPPAFSPSGCLLFITGAAH